MADADRIPYFRVSSDDVGGDAAFAAFQQSVQDVFALKRLGEQPYRLDLIAWHLGTLMLGRFRSSALTFDRGPHVIATGGLDHLLVQLYVEGGFTGTAADRIVHVRPGDIVIFDLLHPFSTRATDFQNISFLLPRVYFEPICDSVDALHGEVLAASNPLGGVLASYMKGLAERMPLLSGKEADAAARATCALVTTMLAGIAQPRTKTVRSCQSPFRRAALEIDRRLAEPALNAHCLAEAMGVSRASLYRAFEPVGGVADYIRRRRLTAAVMAMSAPDGRQRKVADIAHAVGFSSESSFSRAFESAFGLRPGAARDRSGALWATLNQPHGDQTDGADFARWMRTLHG